MAHPSVGTKAPWPAGVTTQDGTAVDLVQHRGRHVLIYFYPKDDTPGCTIEACNFRDHGKELDAIIYGVSLDNAASHQAFRAKFQLPFDLLVDPKGALATAYGALPAGGQHPSRVSFLIDPEGQIKAAWPKVDPKIHWEEVKAAIG